MGSQEMPIQCQTCPLSVGMDTIAEDAREIANKVSTDENLSPEAYLEALEYKTLSEGLASYHERVSEAFGRFMGRQARRFNCAGPLDGTCMMDYSAAINVLFGEITLEDYLNG